MAIAEALVSPCYNVYMDYLFLKKTERGFTLVELIVVIAIVGLLATVIFFAIDSARAHGRDTARVASIAQLQLALKLYHDEHGSYPTITSDPEFGTCETGGDMASLRGASFKGDGCMNVLVKEGFLPALPVNPGYGASWSDPSYFEYDNWCRGGTTINNAQPYRLWVYGEFDNNGLASNWWDEEVIGATTCVDPS